MKRGAKQAHLVGSTRSREVGDADAGHHRADRTAPAAGRTGERKDSTPAPNTTTKPTGECSTSWLPSMSAYMMAPPARPAGATPEGYGSPDDGSPCCEHLISPRRSRRGIGGGRQMAGGDAGLGYRRPHRRGQRRGGHRGYGLGSETRGRRPSPGAPRRLRIVAHWPKGWSGAELVVVENLCSLPLNPRGRGSRSRRAAWAAP